MNQSPPEADHQPNPAAHTFHPVARSAVEQDEQPTERSTLLSKPNGSVEDAAQDETFVPDSKSTARNVFWELWVLFKTSIPVILAYMLQNSLQTVSIVIVGRVFGDDPRPLATAAFTYMFATATAWILSWGGSTAIDTLASSTYTASQEKTEIGVILQRGIVVLTLLYIPVCIVWGFANPLFKALGQEDYIAEDGSKFLWVLIPGGLGYMYFECVKKFLQAQGIMRPGTYVLIITSPINAGLNFLFIKTAGLGLLGAPLATGISYWLSFILLVLYICFVDGSACWGGWSRRCLHDLGTITKLALLGFIQIGTEWWAFEIVAIVAGNLGTIPLAAQSVIMTADQILNTIPFGLGMATTARVGNLLGARDAIGAKRAANTAAVLSMILGCIVLAILLGVKGVFARIFNDDVRVIDLTAAVMPYVALFQIADGLNGSCGGALRGQGRQHVGAVVNVVSYYCAALPLGISLAFKGWGLAGLWVGQCIALYLVGIIEWAIVSFSNWELEVAKAFQRMGKEELLDENEQDLLARRSLLAKFLAKYTPAWIAKLHPSAHAEVQDHEGHD